MFTICSFKKKKLMPFDYRYSYKVYSNNFDVGHGEYETEDSSIIQLINNGFMYIFHNECPLNKESKCDHYDCKNINNDYKFMGCFNVVFMKVTLCMDQEFYYQRKIIKSLNESFMTINMDKSTVNFNLLKTCAMQCYSNKLPPELNYPYYCHYICNCSFECFIFHEKDRYGVSYY